MNDYPADEIIYWQVWYANNLTPLERIEWTLARMAATLVDTQIQSRNHKATKPDYYTYPNQWKKPLAADAQAILNAFGMTGNKIVSK